MDYRRLGNSGLIVSAVSLGSMQFGQKANLGALDQDATTAQIKFAMDHGINFIDTANVYSRGESEDLIGGAIKGIRQELVIATKARSSMSDTDFNMSGSHRVNIMNAVEDSLKRLQTDYIDLYQLHGWDSKTPLEETLRALDDLVRQGKVRYIGMSNWMAWQVALALGLQEKYSLNKFITAQMYYSLMGRDLEHDFIPFCDYTGVGILVWSALAGGFLSGKYDRNTPPPKGTRHGDTGRNFLTVRDEDLGYRCVDALREVGQRHGVSPVRVAIAWTLARPMISSVIIAARKNEHLEDNILAVDLKLTDEDFKTLHEASDPGLAYPGWQILGQDVVRDPRSRTLEPEKFDGIDSVDDYAEKFLR
jgi:aryl-alcohol dehydrogenase-like predicted oxidoreductase